MRILIAGLLCLNSSVAVAASVAHPKGKTERQLSTYVDSFAKSGLFSGVVLVERHGHPILFTANGVAERSFGTRVTLDTKFHIASLSKPITSAAIGRLVDQGKLTYETKLESIVQGIPNGHRISIEQLLVHRSGLDSPDRDKGSSVWMAQAQTTDQLVERMRAMKPLYEPGEKYEYANANYWLLANIIEKVSGVPYGTFLKREIFDPLGMKDTAHRGDILRVVPKLAEGYQLDGPSGYRGGDRLDWTSKSGNGSIYSTAADLAKFYQALVGRKVLSPATTDRILGIGKKYGYAWFHRDPTTYGRESVQYNGRSPGYGSYLEGFVNDDTFVIILSNLYTYAPTAMADGIANILWDKPYENMRPIRLYPMTDATLRPFEGTYQFGPDFHVRNGKARLDGAADHLEMHWDAGDRVTMLLPIGPNRFFDPTFWATIEFVDIGGHKEIRYQSLGFKIIYKARPVS